MSNIDKHKLSLFNKALNLKYSTIDNLGVALHIRTCYNNAYDKNFKNKVEFEYVCEKLRMDESLIDQIFGYNYSNFEDSESVLHLNKCMDELIVLKSLSLI